jgi:hypothetical protein
MNMDLATWRLQIRPGATTLPGSDMKTRASGKPKRLELGEHIVADPSICQNDNAVRIP